MIQRFNFYDIYGYLLPGLTLLSLICLPVGLVRARWPDRGWSSALLAMALAYIAGHLIQALAVNALPSKVKHRNRLRFPSDIVLDKTDDTFPHEFKARLEREVKALFDLDLRSEDNPSPDRDKERGLAFFLCRSTLIKDRVVSYGEQFEGMYTFMRGLAIAFGFGFLWHLGWALASVQGDCLKEVAIGAVFVALIAAIALEFTLATHTDPEKLPRYVLGCIGIGLLSLGYFCGYGDVSGNSAIRLTLIAVGCGFACLRSFRAYRYFAREFAKAIYRDFYTHRRVAEIGGDGARIT
jgi:hypothetical protein